MAFLTPTPPDITESLPGQIGTSLTDAYPPSGGWDVSVGPLGFLLASSSGNPYQRATEDVRKQQIDTSDAPGEQSLSSWWTRSQDTWDKGAGVRWYEPTTDEETVDRFADSYGIDPWTPGEIKLLKRMLDPSPDVGADVYVAGLEVGGVLGCVAAYGSTVAWAPPLEAGDSGTLPGASATQPSAAGGIAWVGHDGGVSRYEPNVGVTTPITCTGVARAWWIKARLIVAVGPALYEVAPSGADLDEQTPIYTHPSSGWVWSDVAETSGAILAAGYEGGDSAVFRFTIENDETNTPILSGASQVGRTAPGERITCMGVYLGSTLVLGTSQGVRVGQVSDAGDMAWGKLTVTTTSDVTDVTFRDRFAYLAVSGQHPNGASGAVRVDLSTPVDDSDAPRYAYAWDAAAGTGTCTSLCLVGERVVLCVDRRVYTQSATSYVDEGWLNTGGIRFATVEPKAFRLVRTVVATNGGGCRITVTAPDGSENRVVEFTDAFHTEDDLGLMIPGRPINQYISLNVYLTPSADKTQTPVLSALSVKAAPAPSRVRLFSLPLSVHDFETDRYGNRLGKAGGAYERLAALESLEESAIPVRIIDNRTSESFIGQIDRVDFSASLPPSKGEHNFEGVATVRIRRL